jgi:antitoxin CptB
MNEQKKISSNELTKIQWACRRGMLELDVLLGNFFKDQYAALTAEQKNLFVELLEQPDPILFSWLLGQAEPTEKHFVQMTNMIRDHAKSRTQL